ncbi:MAG: COX15/CtaA family protein [Planctomycetota bacterium]
MTDVNPGKEPRFADQQRRTLVGWLGCVLVLLTWPMIWVGGLVTTYDAGMSVPDWPGTYGYNLLLYPVSTWLFGPFDLFIEHGHRLLGATIGFIAIGFLIAAWRLDARRWVVALALFVLLAVIGQGILGGLRVTQSARTLAMVHGCTATAFFGLCVFAAMVTGPKWMSERLRSESMGNNSRLTKPSFLGPILVMFLAYGQLILGAQLRHVSPMTSATGFGHVAATHVTLAFALWLATIIIHWTTRRRYSPLANYSMTLIILVGAQIALGIATWIVNYGFPAMLKSLPGSDRLLLQSKDLIDAAIVTGHVAIGSMIFAVATAFTIRTARCRWLASKIARPADSWSTEEGHLEEAANRSEVSRLQPA